MQISSWDILLASQGLPCISVQWKCQRTNIDLNADKLLGYPLDYGKISTLTKYPRLTLTKFVFSGRDVPKILTITFRTNNSSLFFPSYVIPNHHICISLPPYSQIPAIVRRSTLHCVQKVVIPHVVDCKRNRSL